MEEIVGEFQIVPQEQFSERVCAQSADVSVSSTPQVDVRDTVPPASEEMVEVVLVTPHERGQERIAKQSDVVPPDKEAIVGSAFARDQAERVFLKVDVLLFSFWWLGKFRAPTG